MEQNESSGHPALAGAGSLAERESVENTVLPSEARRYTHTKKRDAQEMFRACLDSPVSDGEVAEFDGRTSLESMRNKNTTALARIFLAHTAKAMKGDPKSTEIVFKYAGLEPKKEVEVNLPPLILNDIFTDDTEVVDAEYTIKDKDDIAVVDDPRLD